MRSDTFKEIAAALAAAQCEMENATANSANPDFRTRYADLGAVRNACVPILAKNGIAVSQIMERDADNLLVLSTELLHKSGEWIRSEFPLPEKLLPDQPQAFGSALSYARRYSLGAICGIATDHDDDGNIAVVGLNIRPTETHQQATERMESAPGAPVSAPVPPKPPAPPEPPVAVDSSLLFKGLDNAASLDMAVDTFTEWGFHGSNAAPSGTLAALLKVEPAKYDELVAHYRKRLKELAKGGKPKEAA